MFLDHYKDKPLKTSGKFRVDLLKLVVCQDSRARAVHQEVSPVYKTEAEDFSLIG